MKTPAPEISIVIPARNEGSRIAKAITTFASGRSYPFPLEFIIVDDASDDGCCDKLASLLNWQADAACVRVIRLDQWSGIPRARNTGAQKAKAPILFITDANVEAVAGWDIPVFRDLRPMRALCATIADIGSAWRGYGCVLDIASMGINWLLDPNAYKRHVPVSPCTGTVLPAALFHRLGGYDTAMPVYGAAEPEFSVRLWLYGGEIMSCPDLILRHRFRPPEERKPFLEQIEFTQTVNYLRFGLLYLEEKETMDLYDYWAQTSPQHFTRALQQAKTGKTLARRSHLQASLTRDFTWYINNFGLAKQGAQLEKA